MPRPVLRSLAAVVLAAGVSGLVPIVSGAAFASSVYQVPATVVADCSVDVTSQLLSWVAGVPNGSVLSFGTNGCYRIESTLDLSNRSGLDFEGNGSTFRSFNAPTDGRAIWRLQNSTGMILRNMRIVGSYANGGTYTSTLEHAHGIDLRGTGVEISGVSISSVGGDCVYFGLYGTGTRSSGNLHDSSCTGTSRNAVSVTAGDNITVKNVTTSSVGYIAFDVEPNVGAGFGAQNVVFDHNTIGSYQLIAFSVVENEPITGVAFTNNTANARGLKITAGAVSSTVYRPHDITISGNSDSIAQAPASMNIDNVDGLLISGNNVALTSGTMAQVSASCQVSVFGNSYPGGSTESSITSTPANCPPPSITSFTPTTGTSGTTVTVSGDNFIGATKVTVGGVAVPFAVGSNKQVNITAPSSGGTIDVITPYGTAVSATDFGTTSTTPGAPAVTSFSPTSGPVGTSVTITGSAFTGATSVAFGGVAATFAVVSDTQITASVPTGAGSGPISVATPYGATRSTSSFSVTTAPAPAISSFSPSSGPAGTRVTISGSGFTGATAVAFNGRAATFTVQSATSISAVVPAGARSGPITVTTPGGTAVSAKRYRVK